MGKIFFNRLAVQKILRVIGEKVTITHEGVVIKEIHTSDPLKFIEDYQSNIEVELKPELPKFIGGLVGYFGYDCIRYIEPRLKNRAPVDLLGTPDALFMISEEVAIFDNLENKLNLVVLSESGSKADLGRAQDRLLYLSKKLEETLPDSEVIKSGDPISEEDFISSFGENEFKAAVEKIKEYIKAGDVMQVVGSQRLSIPFSADPIELYQSIRYLKPISLFVLFKS